MQLLPTTQGGRNATKDDVFDCSKELCPVTQISFTNQGTETAVIKFGGVRIVLIAKATYFGSSSPGMYNKTVYYIDFPQGASPSDCNVAIITEQVIK